MKNITLFLLLVLFGCNEEYSANLLKESTPPQVAFSNAFTLELADSISVELPKGIPNYLGLTDVLENDSLYYFKYAKNKIAKIDYSTARVDSIVLPEEVITGNLLSICRIGHDSLLVAQDNPQSLILIKEKKSAEFIYLSKIEFETSNTQFSKLTEAMSEEEANFLFDYSNLAYDAESQLVHIGLQPYDAYRSSGFENSERVATFDLKTKKWHSTYAAPEGMNKLRGDKTYSYNMSQKKIVLKNDTTFVNYTNDHHIYFYQNGEYLGKFPHISTKSKNLFLPVDLEDADDTEAMKKYSYSAPKYSSFYYHEKLNLYSRFYFDEQDPIDENGKYKPRNLLRDVYVTFLDEAFNHVGEFKFPNGSLAFSGAKPLSDGFMIFDVTAQSNNQFGLKYVYKIKAVPTKLAINKLSND